MTTLSQTDRIAAILKRRGYIDNFHAINTRISLRLGARIWQLRSRGWLIKTVRLENRNTSYRLVSTPKKIKKTKPTP
jgi:ribosomal protein S8